SGHSRAPRQRSEKKQAYYCRGIFPSPLVAAKPPRASPHRALPARRRLLIVLQQTDLLLVVDLFNVAGDLATIERTPQARASRAGDTAQRNHDGALTDWPDEVKHGGRPCTVLDLRAAEGHIVRRLRIEIVVHDAE